MGQQFLGSPELGLCAAQQGTVAGQDGLSAGDLCLELAVMSEAEQEISGHNVPAPSWMCRSTRCHPCEPAR